MSDTPTQNPYLIQTNPVENRTVQFFKDSVQVGCFDFGVSPVTFTGDVDESARIFVDYVISKVQTELTATREELKAVTEQRDKYRDVASELIAMIRINVMRDTFKIATIEQVDEHLKPWIARIAAVKGGADES